MMTMGLVDNDLMKDIPIPCGLFTLEMIQSLRNDNAGTLDIHVSKKNTHHPLEVN